MHNELVKRIISSIILIPIAFFFIIKGSYLFCLFLLPLFLISSYEWYSMSKNKLHHFYGYIFLIISFYCVYKLRMNNDNNFKIFSSMSGKATIDSMNIESDAFMIIDINLKKSIEDELGFAFNDIIETYGAPIAHDNEQDILVRLSDLIGNDKIITSASGVWKILKIKPSDLGPGG